ncbi:hypothetical protein PR048_023928 [Dryococelus australis]|uniref:Uncharacterized protein n=1 Tax=Dryococelus australis TaxID=614101 RepID=A0ABQ9GVF7_9NEOP|nr:hypothetical protein PR048_023928 [Dryococelus australis]
MLEEFGSSPYTISYDGTTNAESKEELQVTITYWSDLQNQVVKRHLETFFTGKTDALTLHSLLFEEKLEICSKGLVDMGTGPVHVVHNAFLKAMEVFGDDVMTLLIGVYHYCHG